jgi:hypothetical protein
VRCCLKRKTKTKTKTKTKKAVCRQLTPVILATQEAEISSKSAWANSSRDPILKNPSQKRTGGVAQGVDPEFKPQHQIIIITQNKQCQKAECLFNNHKDLNSNPSMG